MRIAVLGLLAACGSSSRHTPDAGAQDARAIDSMIDAAPDAATCAAKPASLAGRWRADMNANDSAGTYNGTTHGTLTYTAGKYGSAFALDGSTSYVTVDDGDTLWPAGSFSISAWINTEYNTGQIVEKYQCWDSCTVNVSNAYWALYVLDGDAGFDTRSDASTSTNTVLDTHSIADGQWHQIVGVRDSTMSKMILYVDGTAVGSQALNSVDNGAMTNNDGEVDPITIGAQGVATQPSYAPNFNGWIDEVAYFGDALTPQQVADMYGLPQGLCP